MTISVLTTACSTTTYTTPGSPEVDDWLRSHESKRATVVLREPAQSAPEGFLLPPDGPNRPIRLAPLTFAPSDDLIIPIERVREMKARERSGFQGLLIGGALGILSGIIAGAVKEPKDRETWGNDCWFECSNGGMMYMYGLMLGVAGLLVGATIGRSIEHDSVLSLDPAPAPGPTLSGE